MFTVERRFMKKLIVNPNTIVYGKKYDWIAGLEEGKKYFLIKRRVFEGEQWEIYCRAVMIGDIIFTNFCGL